MGPFIYYVTRIGEEGLVGLLRFVTWGRGGPNLCYVTKKNVTVLKDMGEEMDERNDCPSRKIVGIRAIEE